MTEIQGTTFENKCKILAEIWSDFKEGNPDYEYFVAYNHLGLPLAYAIATGVVESSSKAEMLINKTFDMFLESVGKFDSEFETLDDIFATDNFEPEH